MLVIIGLLVGGVLVGGDMIRSAGERAQITQIEKYNTAANTFRQKYNALPGDINIGTAAQFGFTPRGPYSGQGDGNGTIEGNATNAPNGQMGFYEAAGETVMFWVDLTTSNGMNINLIDGVFNTATPIISPGGSNIPGTSLNLYFPQAKIGGGNFVYVYSGANSSYFVYQQTGINYFGIAAFSSYGMSQFGDPDPRPGLTVRQAYDIDAKLDDGLPQSGNVTAKITSCWGQEWSHGGGSDTGCSPIFGPFDTSATAGSSTTCFDNGNVGGAIQNYSLGQKNGSGMNCALSFKFQ